ncbi:uncharacterized protein ARMOST_19070 [Armillaria ostoyae]|uniref:Uncharacterized protein n=1 Tax=Armillaria ostoyae TaxID=47428 RepID=A0A284S3K1_ARMOS|nr:uncharacterized protein ARMOST_19070 [Armillaria ostoyae]
MTDHRPSHVLSSISSELQRGAFIWSNTYPSHLVIGINQRLTPVTSALLKRWTHDIMQSSWKEFHLCPVEVRTCGVLYFAEPKKKSPILMVKMQSFKATQSTHIQDFFAGRRLIDPRKILLGFLSAFT